jgi:hypothetical protein
VHGVEETAFVSSHATALINYFEWLGSSDAYFRLRGPLPSSPQTQTQTHKYSWDAHAAEIITTDHFHEPSGFTIRKRLSFNIMRDAASELPTGLRLPSCISIGVYDLRLRTLLRSSAGYVAVAFHFTER